jgi:hypothetical protein
METTANFHCLIPESPGSKVATSNTGAALAGMGLGVAGWPGAVWVRVETAAKMKIGSLNPNEDMY